MRGMQYSITNVKYLSTSTNETTSFAMNLTRGWSSGLSMQRPADMRKLWTEYYDAWSVASLLFSRRCVFDMLAVCARSRAAARQSRTAANGAHSNTQQRPRTRLRRRHATGGVPRPKWRLCSEQRRRHRRGLSPSLEAAVAARERPEQHVSVSTV